MDIVERIRKMRKCRKMIATLSIGVVLLFLIVFIRVSFEGLAMFSCISGVIAVGIIALFIILYVLDMLTEPS